MCAEVGYYAAILEHGGRANEEMRRGGKGCQGICQCVERDGGCRDGELMEGRDGFGQSFLLGVVCA